MPLSLAFVVVAVSAAVSSAGVALVHRWAVRRGWFDVPDDRRLHRVPTPRGGGLAIVVVTLAGVLAALPWLAPADRWAMGAVAGIGSVIAAVSWLSESGRTRKWPPLVRLAVHVAVAVVTVAALGLPETTRLPIVGDLALGAVAGVVAVLWIVGLTNAYNFMDGVDGMAGGQAVVAGLGWMWIGYGGVPLMGALLAGAGAGFLAHNWSPARIFMGDVGSTFLGYVFAAMSLVAGRSDAGAVLAGCLLVWPFVFDSFITFLRRLWRREDVLAPHVSHLYQRLVLAGWTHRQVASLYVLLASLGVPLAVALDTGLPGAGAAAVAVPATTGAGLLALVRVTEARGARVPPGSVPPR